MYALQALQMDGTWYTLSHHTTQSAATYAMLERGSYKNRTVKYRVVRS